MVDYERDTLNAYKSSERAQEYKQFHTSQMSWGRIVTWFEQRAIRNLLNSYDWSRDDELLDIPCGTGILGTLLHDFSFQIVVSDISAEMMALAEEEYPADRLKECVVADITNTGFERDRFSCIVTLGFLHRVPTELKIETLKELHRISGKVVIASSSVATPLQRLKHKILGVIRRKHVPAPCALPESEITELCKSQGFKVRKVVKVLPVLSAHALFLLEV